MGTHSFLHELERRVFVLRKREVLHLCLALRVDLEMTDAGRFDAREKCWRVARDYCLCSSTLCELLQPHEDRTKEMGSEMVLWFLDREHRQHRWCECVERGGVLVL